ncbi:histidine phosphatase family protein [Aestuariibius sp. HNIBRBA575]|uniref:histidine phosphatase family protein n=1 Tax=Aestuariibius sp. HNIBRBA575 TaxID=3233343 RepID=UPI0034A53D45
MTKPLEICLFRHGEVEFDKWAWSSASSLRALVEHYDSQQIILPPTTPPPANHFEVVVCSCLPRSISSAKTLFQRYDRSDELFREAELPNLPPLPLKLPAIILFVIARMMWRCGAEENCESYAAFKGRAKDAARELVGIAETNTNVAFVGHGLINFFIAQELLQLGFEGPKAPIREHWAGPCIR